MRNGEYELVVAPDEYPGRKYRDRYVYEHQLVWWKRTGKLVPDGYLIHHKNDNKRDNRFVNLELKSRAQHTHDHKFGCIHVPVTCAHCGRSFSLPFRVYRTRRKHSQSSKLFCSKSHQVYAQQQDRWAAIRKVNDGRPCP